MTIKEEYSGILANKVQHYFQVTRAATTYFPEPEGGWETIVNCKKEGWTVGTQLLVDIEDPEILEKMKKEATKLGITVDEMMIILKNEITMENCTATISIASDINKNTDIQEIANKMKSILGGEVKSHSLLLNTKPISASHANYGRGKIEEKYDVVTAKYRPGTVRVE